MKEVVEFFKNLADVKDFPARWHCGRWSGFHGWLYIISDLLIGLAYFVIPILIIKYITRKGSGVRFHWLYFLFASFIWFCGLTHFIDTVIFWVPIYRISAILRLATALISWVTIVYLAKLIPVAFSLKSPKELEKEIALRKRIEEKLIVRNQQLQEYKEIAKLGSWQWEDGRMEWSSLACKLFEFSSTVDIDRTAFLEHIHIDDREFVDSIMYGVLQTKTFPEFYCRIVTSSQAVKHVMIRGALKFDDDGNVVLMNGTIQDITAQREAVAKIQMQNKKLREIAWIHAHKVRSPLSSVLGLTDLLAKEALNDEQKELVTMLQKAASNLDDTISDITQRAHLLELS